MEDRVADQLRNLGNYGVSEGFYGSLVHVCGKPIMPSTHEGQVSLAKCAFKLTCLPIRSRLLSEGFDKFPLSRKSLARGVGNKPQPITEMWGTNGCRWYALPFRIKPDLGQRPKDGGKPTQQVWAVFHDDEAGSYFANEARILEPKPAALTLKSCTAAGRRKVLAREPTADDINGNSIGSKSLCGKFSHVAVARDAGPVLGEDFAGELFDFAERDGFKAIVWATFMSGALQPKAKAADAREKIEDAELGHLTPPIIIRAPHQPIWHECNPARVKVERRADQGRAEVVLCHADASMSSSALVALL